MEATSPCRTIDRYVALGDSFTAGTPGVDRGVRFPDALAAELRAVNGPLEYHNLGVVGARTAEVADGQLARCIELAPDLVTVVCGANDVLLTTRPDIEAHAEALDGILRTLAAELPDAVLMTATSPDFSGFMPLRPRSRRRVERGMRELNEATRAAARRHGALLLDFAAHPQAGERDNFGADGYHPSDEGTRRAARGAARALVAGAGIHIAEEEEA